METAAGKVVDDGRRMHMRILSWKDAALSAASGYIVYTLPLWVKQEAAIYAGIVAGLAAVYVLIALNERNRQKKSPAA